MAKPISYIVDWSSDSRYALLRLLSFNTTLLLQQLDGWVYAGDKYIGQPGGHTHTHIHTPLHNVLFIHLHYSTGIARASSTANEIEEWFYVTMYKVPTRESLKQQ